MRNSRNPPRGTSILLILLSSFKFILLFTSSFTAAAAPPHLSGWWELLQRSIGVSAMHMQLLNNDRVVIFDRTDFGPSNISLPHDRCLSGLDCTAHAVEYDVPTNTFRPLTLKTDIWCSSGAAGPDGRLIQTGGNVLGSRVVRLFSPCKTRTCDWHELGLQLFAQRWYATDHILPDGRVFIVGGRGQFNYEFYPKTQSTNTLQPLPFLGETNDVPVENNLYPFVFLNTDGNLFIYANNRSILLDYKNNLVVREYPTIPGSDPRNYPSTGSAVLLPLRNLESTVDVEVLVCGGAPTGSFQQALNGVFRTALDTCAKMNINDRVPLWTVETMPIPRCLGDMVMLPNGRVLIINGVRAGTASWEMGRDAVMRPVVYDSEKPYGSRFKVLAAGTIPRVYHSTAILLRDGRVMVGGSNPHDKYEFTGVLYPTELSLEAFYPPYLDERHADLRAVIVSPESHARVGYGKVLGIRFSVKGKVEESRVKVTMLPPPFNTHSFSMGQRLLVLSQVEGGGVVGLDYNDNDNDDDDGVRVYEVKVRLPRSGNIAPPGYYMVFVVHWDIPSEGLWVHLH